MAAATTVAVIMVVDITAADIMGALTTVVLIMRPITATIRIRTRITTPATTRTTATTIGTTVAGTATTTVGTTAGTTATRVAGAAVGVVPTAVGAAGPLLGAPLAWLLARLTYHPVRDVTKTARSITTTGELDRRCFYAGPRDDVGELVVTVNELLVRYDAAIGRLRRLQIATPTCTCPRVVAEPDPADLVVVELMARDAASLSQPGS